MLSSLALLLPCFVCLTWSIILFSRWKTNYNAQNATAVTLLLVAIADFSYTAYLMGSDNWRENFWIYVINMISTLAILPLVIRFFRLLTKNKPYKWWNNLGFAPMLILVCLTGGGYCILPEDAIIPYFCKEAELLLVMPTPTPPSLFFYFINLSFMLILYAQMIYTMIYASVMLHRYRRELDEYYTSHLGKNLNLNYVILSALILLSLDAGVCMTVPDHIFRNNLWIFVVLQLVFASTLYVLAQCVYKIRYTINDLTTLQHQMDEDTPDRPYDRGGVPDINGYVNISYPEKKNYPEKLEADFSALIDKEQVFLRPDLRLDHITRALSTNRTYISRMINQLHGMTFSDYINAKRIEYAKMLMTERKQAALGEIAEQSGFFSSSSFYRTFKQGTGLTPSEWKQQCGEKSENK